MPTRRSTWPAGARYTGDRQGNDAVARVHPQDGEPAHIHHNGRRCGYASSRANAAPDHLRQPLEDGGYGRTDEVVATDCTARRLRPGRCTATRISQRMIVDGTQPARLLLSQAPRVPDSRPGVRSVEGRPEEGPQAGRSFSSASARPSDDWRARFLRTGTGSVAQPRLSYTELDLKAATGPCGSRRTAPPQGADSPRPRVNPARC